MALIAVAAVVVSIAGWSGKAATAADASSFSTDEATPKLPVTVTNVDGTTTTVTDVSRIIPLNGDIAEVLFALELGPNVVATDISATYPEAAAALPKVGYQRTLSAEGILSFRPTVVIGNADAGPPAVIQQLRDAGIPVILQQFTPSPSAPAKKIRAIAAAVGVPERGDALATKTQSAITRASKLGKSAKSSPRAVFLYLRGSSTQLIFGAGTTATTMITAAHATDTATKAGIKDTAPITAEALVAQAPEVIVVTTSGLGSVGGIDGLLTIPGVAQTPAGQARKVLAYDDQEFLGGGPRTGAALAQFVRDLHPKLRPSRNR